MKIRGDEKLSGMALRPLARSEFWTLLPDSVCWTFAVRSKRFTGRISTSVPASSIVFFKLTRPGRKRDADIRARFFLIE
jgi:hypothetical protein